MDAPGDAATRPANGDGKREEARDASSTRMKGAAMAATAPPRERNQAAPRTIEAPAARSTDLDALFPGRYLSITSFKRDGTAVATPVWFGSDGTRLFAFTDLHSAKVRRIHHNPRVLVASCWVNGKLRREPVAARAEVLTTTAELERVQKLLLSRHKISYRAVMLFYRLGRQLRDKQSVADGAALAITIEREGP
jgi:uncharacterized protein